MEIILNSPSGVTGVEEITTELDLCKTVDLCAAGEVSVMVNISDRERWINLVQSKRHAAEYMFETLSILISPNPNPGMVDITFVTINSWRELKARATDKGVLSVYEVWCEEFFDQILEFCKTMTVMPREVVRTLLVDLAKVSSEAMPVEHSFTIEQDATQLTIRPHRVIKAAFIDNRKVERNISVVCPHIHFSLRDFQINKIMDNSFITGFMKISRTKDGQTLQGQVTVHVTFMIDEVWQGETLYGYSLHCLITGEKIAIILTRILVPWMSGAVNLIDLSEKGSYT